MGVGVAKVAVVVIVFVVVAAVRHTGAVAGQFGITISTKHDSTVIVSRSSGSESGSGSSRSCSGIVDRQYVINYKL